MNDPRYPLPLAEFVVLLALMVSIVALATDVMLPALDVIGRDLGVQDANDAQLVISSLFLGFAIGQLFVGPISDRYGRKPIIYTGYILFTVGCLICIFATSFNAMLIGRALQGLGAASPRIITIALVRDGYEGRAMAKIMSIVMAVFIIVPTIAPAIGQGLIYFGGWRATFILLLILAAICFVWFGVRQPETLPSDKRRDLSFATIANGVAEFFQIRPAIGYTLTTGLIFGPFLGYLSSAQQIFQTVFGAGQMFAFYFGVAALAIGFASIVNSQLVMSMGMRPLSRWAMTGLTVLSSTFLILVLLYDGVPPFFMFMTWLLLSFFCIGIMFGNFGALAMESIGHMAGLGAALHGFLATMIGLPLGWAIGKSFDGGVTPIVAGFAIIGVLSIPILFWIERQGLDKVAAKETS